jgi:hypothetical protein
VARSSPARCRGAADATETLDRKKNQDCHSQIEVAVAVGHDIEPCSFPFGDDAGDRVEILLAEQESPSGLNDRPARLRSNQSGRG